MIDETLSDDDRRFLLGLLMRETAGKELTETTQGMRLISLLAGTGTEVICRRAYLASPEPPDRPLQFSVDPLKFYDLEVDMTVRRTMRVLALNAEMAPRVARGFLALAIDGPGEISSVLKWSDGRTAYRPMPVETILEEPAPVIGEPVEVADD